MEIASLSRPLLKVQVEPNKYMISKAAAFWSATPEFDCALYGSCEFHLPLLCVQFTMLAFVRRLSGTLSQHKFVHEHDQLSGPANVRSNLCIASRTQTKPV